MLACLALTSAMGGDEIIDCECTLPAGRLACCPRSVPRAVIVRLYDFDESNALTVDELTLAFKGALYGAAKLSAEEPPSEEAIDAISRLVSERLSGSVSTTHPMCVCVSLQAFTSVDRSSDALMSREEIRSFGGLNPEVRSWMAFFSDAGDPSVMKVPSHGEVTEGATAGSVQPEDDSDLEAELGVSLGRSSRADADFAIRNLEDDASAVFREVVASRTLRNPASERALQGRQWFRQAEHLVPSIPPTPGLDPPDAALQLEWLHGFNGNRFRGMARYLETGDIAMAAATVGVLLSTAGGPLKHAQQFCAEHVDTVSSLAVHPNGTIIATGEVGKRPRMTVWSAGAGSRVKVHRVLHGFHRGGVSQLAFSPDGTRLASVGCDDTHSIAMYEWARAGVRETAEGVDDVEDGGRALRWSAQNTTLAVFALCWRDDSTIVTAGRDHLTFWDVTSGKKLRGFFGRAPGIRIQTVLSLAAFAGPNIRGDGTGALVAAGTMSGHVYIWRGRCCVRAVLAHDGPILDLCGKSGGLVTASRDGRVRVWDAALAAATTVDVSTLGPYDSAVSSVDWDVGRGRLLVGTRGCEVFELSAVDGRNLHDDSGVPGPVVQGHCRHEVWGLAAHPSREEYCTVGDDGTLRVWDATTHRLVRLARLGCPGRAVAYSPDGEFLAVGLGAPAKTSIRRKARGRLPDKDGGFIVVRSSDLALVHSARDAREYVTCLRFSPDGRTLALASHDSNIYLYEGSDFALRCVCTKHTAPVRHVDFTEHGDLIQSLCDAHEHKFFHCDDGRPQTAVSAMKDVHWDSWSLTGGWHVQGLWSGTLDDVEVLSAERSAGGAVVLSGDSVGRIRLHRFPAVSSAALSNASIVHGDAVSGVRWTANDHHVVSLGGNDGCVAQWRVVGDTGPGAALLSPAAMSKKARATTDEPAGEEAMHVDPDSDDELDLESGPSFERSLAHEAARALDEESRVALLALRRARLPGPPSADDEELSVSDTSGRETMDPPRKWRSLAVEPTDPPPKTAAASLPDVDLRLEWIHGFNGRDTRNSLYYVSGGMLVYPASTVGVLYSPLKQSQAFLQAHTDLVRAVAVHPSKRFVATAQQGRRPFISVWQVDSRMEVARIRGAHERGVVCLSFGGPNGSLLATVGADDRHTMKLFDWKSASMVCAAEGGREAALGVAVNDAGSVVAQVGDGYVRFHELCTRGAVSRRGVLGRVGRRQPFYSVRFRRVMVLDRPKEGEEGVGRSRSVEECLVGTHDGHVYAFGEDLHLHRAVKAHSGAVYALSVADMDGGDVKMGSVASGGRDGLVRLWSEEFEPLVEMDMASYGSVDSAVRGVDWDVGRGRLLVGTRGCEVFELSAVDGRNLHDDSGVPGPVVQGHCRHEVWGLATHPSREEYCTVGDDGTLRVWDATHLCQAAVVDLSGVARAVAYSPDGKFIAVGMGGDVGHGRTKDDGKWSVVSTADWTIIHRAHDTRTPVTDIKFTADGATLGVAAADGRLFLYDVTGGFTLRGVFDKHKGRLEHFDFSRDGKRLQTSSDLNDLLYADVATGAHLPSATTMRDIAWLTHTTPIGWSKLGLWPAEPDGMVVTACDASKSGRTIISGDSFGRMSVQRFPAFDVAAAKKSLALHASGVTNIRWDHSDSRVVSTSRDRSVCQWQVVSDAEAVAVASESVIATLEEADNAESVQAVETLILTARRAVERRSGAAKPKRIDVDDDVDGKTEEAFVAPTRAPSLDTRRPQEQLRLEWAHGFRANDTHSTLWFSSERSVAFPAGAVGVLFDMDRHSQRFYHGHQHSITCMAVDPAGALVASGDCGPANRLHVWSAHSGRPLTSIPRTHSLGAGCVAFSRDSRRVVSVGTGEDHHSITVCKSVCGDWTDGAIEARSAGDSRRVLFVCCLPGAEEEAALPDASDAASLTAPVPSHVSDLHSSAGSDLRFVTGGVDHVRFWRLERASLTSQVGLFGAKGKVQTVTCGAVIAGVLVTGTVSGHLYAWRGRVVSRVVEAFNPGTRRRAVQCMHPHSAGVVVGCRDGCVRLFSTGLVPLASFDVSEVSDVPPLFPSVQSVCLSPDGETVLVGTRGGDAYEIALSTGRATQRFESHASGRLCSVASHPTSDAIAATGGDDGTVRLWDLQSRRPLVRTNVGAPVRAVSWSPDGSVVAAGLAGATPDVAHSVALAVQGLQGGPPLCIPGGLTLLRADTLETIHETRDMHKDVVGTKFSPNGTLLAVAADDARVLIYDARGGRFALTYTLDRHSGHVRHLDFKDDSSALQVEGEGAELLYFDLRTGRQVASGTSMRDASWSTWSCLTGWPVSGVSQRILGGPPLPDWASEVDRSKTRSLLAVAGRDGATRLVRFPAAATSEPYEFQEALGHGGAVSSVKFSASDRFVLSTGLEDRTLFQWRVIHGPNDAAKTDP
jgi:WD40 repeat protein